jgi:hypothetical protein
MTISAIPIIVNEMSLLLGSLNRDLGADVQLLYLIRSGRHSADRVIKKLFAHRP